MLRHTLPINYHNPQATAVFLNAEEMSLVAATVAEKLNKAIGPVRFLIPLRGFSGFDIEGREYRDPDRDQAFINTLKSKLKPSIPIIEVDAHINDRLFGEKVVEHFLELQE